MPADPLLQQIPLIVSPFFNPPKAVVLPFEYKPLPSRLPATSITRDNLDAWKAECQGVKAQLERFGEQDTLAYKEWQASISKVAPGYLESGTHLLVPRKQPSASAGTTAGCTTGRTGSPTTGGGGPTTGGSDIDQAFTGLRF